MLDRLQGAVKQALSQRDLRADRIGEILVEAKAINYGTLQIREDVQEIEDRLEDRELMDSILIVRAYLVAYCHLTEGIDWWSIVDLTERATDMVLLEGTTNTETKEEYYRTYNPRGRLYHTKTEASGQTNQSLWRANDWLVVLWFCSWIPATWLESLTAGN